MPSYVQKGYVSFIVPMLQSQNIIIIIMPIKVIVID